MAVTVKKKSLKLKSAAEEDAAPTEAPAMPEVPEARPSGGAGDAIAGVAALIATLCFAVLIALQWMELQSYRPMFPDATAAASYQ